MVVRKKEAEPLSVEAYTIKHYYRRLYPPTTLEHYFDSKPPLTTNQTHIQLYFILSPRTILTTYNLTSAPRPANCTHPYTSHLQLPPNPPRTSRPIQLIFYPLCLATAGSSSTDSPTKEGIAGGRTGPLLVMMRLRGGAKRPSGVHHRQVRQTCEGGSP